MRYFFVLLACLTLLMYFPRPTAFAENQNATEIQVKLAGLVCDFCARAIEKTFSKQGEVAQTSIDLTTKQLTLRLKPGANLDNATIETLVKNAGYNVIEIKREGEAPGDSEESK